MSFRTGYLVGGILCILILGVGGTIVAVAGLTGTCSNSPLAQNLTGVPSCNSLLGVAAFGFILLVIGLTVGIVLLIKSYRREPQPPTTLGQAWQVPSPAPPQGLAPGTRVCLGCGRVLPTESARFCPFCGRPTPG